MEMNTFKKWIALFLAICMILTSGIFEGIRLSANSDEETGDTENTTEEVEIAGDPEEETVPEVIKEEESEPDFEEVVKEEKPEETVPEETGTEETDPEKTEEEPSSEPEKTPVEEEKKEEKTEEPKVEETAKITEVVYQDNEVIVTVTGEGIPQDAKLVVKAITMEKDPEKFGEVVDALNESDVTVGTFRAYDITFVDNKTGKEVEPTGPVSVSMQYVKPLDLTPSIVVEGEENTEPVKEDMTVLHLEENRKGEVVDVVDLSETKEIEEIKTNKDGEVKEVSFTTESFSIYVFNDPNAYSASVPLAESITLTCNIPQGHYNHWHGWYTADGSIASVAGNNNQAVVTGLKEGKTTIYCSGSSFNLTVTGPKPLTTVRTVDSTSKGVTIRMVDLKQTDESTRNLANGEYKVALGGTYGDGSVKQNLLSKTLKDGYPTSTKDNNKSLSGLFTGAKEVNHLFLQSTYDATGYFRYSSFENYAYLGSNGNFTVYEQIGTPKDGNDFYYQRGNFMPYNSIMPGKFSTKTNSYDHDGNLLNDNAPRKGEKLYLTQGTNNFFFGMEMTADFWQTENGKDKSNNPIIYNFNGDDDLWIYVDNVLLLDIGGVSDAHTGEINFSTGNIWVNTGKGTVNTTIKAQFKAAKIFPDGTKWDDSKVDLYFKGNTFADYTSHTFKMFYFERGAGASNLEMKFNLATIPSGVIIGSKRWKDKDTKTHDNAKELAGALVLYSDYDKANEFKPVSSDKYTIEWGYSGQDYMFQAKPVSDGDLPAGRSGRKIQYQVREETVPSGYEVKYTSNTDIVNSYIAEFEGYKVWKDDKTTHDNANAVKLTLKRSYTKGGQKFTEDVSYGTNPADKTKPLLTWDGNRFMFSNLPSFKDANDAGTEYTYFATEAKVTGYLDPVYDNGEGKKTDAVYDGGKIINTIEPGETRVSGTKTWNDADNQDGKRPTTITVYVKNGDETVDTVNLSAGDDGIWSEEELNWISDVLPKYDNNGSVINYTVDEAQVTDYETSIKGTAITNTHTPEKIRISGTKVWDDADNQDGKRPASITVNVMDGKVAVDTIILSAGEDNEWSEAELAWTSVELPKYRNGNEIAYTVSENEVTDYETVISGTVSDGFTVTNTHTPEKTSVSVSKSWSDNNNQDGKRPSKVTVKLLADEVDTGKTITLNEGNQWSGSFTDIDKYKDGNEIAYTVQENAVTDYTAEVTGSASDGYTITNTHTPQKTSVSVTKEWDDNENQDGIRTAKVTVKLYADSVYTKKSLELSETNEWTASFDNLDVYKAGKKIAYTVQETKVTGYNDPVITGTAATGFTVKNTHTPEKTSVSVTKSWTDNNDQDGKRPSGITVKLYAGNVDTGKTVTLNEGTQWKGTFSNLDKYAAGELIAYTVKEAEVDGYESAVTGSAAAGYTITNTHEPLTTSIPVTKSWEDNDNQDGKRPESVTITLVKNNVDTDTTLELSESNDWSATFEDLPVYENKTAITYSIKEVDVDEYTSEITGTAEAGFTVTNTHTPEKTSVPVKKSWSDHDDQDGKRPAGVTVKLLAGGKDTGKTLTLNEDVQWKGTFTGLDKYKDGEVIAYTVEENTVADYTPSVTGTAGAGYTITNTHEPLTTSVPVTKSWDDNNNQDGKRPASVTIRLLKNNAATDKTLVLNDANDWTDAFEDLPVYENKQVITYTIAEVSVTDYESEITGTASTGFTVTNTHTPEKTSVSGSKTWDDADDQDRKRPASITIRLMNGETEVANKQVTADDNWKWNFTNLDKYADGTEIVYSITEDQIGDYSAAYSGTSVTNSYSPGKTSIRVTKSWNDKDNQDGIRPASVTVRLLADEESAGKSIELNQDNNWTDSFTDLDINKDGNPIAYTITEDEVSDYTTSITGTAATGFTVTNTHEVAKTSVSGKKTWTDNDNQDGIRPSSITIRLMNGETEVTHQQVTADDNWQWNFTDLDKFAGGKEIKYSITEDGVDGYTTSYDNSFNVTNTHIPATTSVSGGKTWNDKDNQDGVRPESIKIHLLANGEEKEEKIIKAVDNWAWNFTGLPKYKDGELITYTITEDKVDEYETTVTGYNVTNTHTTETIDIKGSKTWDDNDNQDGKRPTSITIRLFADGTEVAHKLVRASDDWSWEFQNVQKYRTGEVKKAIVYAIKEDQITDYQISYDGYNVINKHVPEKTNVEGTKTWNDAKNQDGKRPASITIRLKKGDNEIDHKVITADDDWSWDFTDLPKYENGTLIAYSITEDNVNSYTTAVEGYDVTNTHIPETTFVSGIKTWDDHDDQDGKRPESITIRLLADDREVAHKVVTEDDNWEWTFTGLQKNRTDKVGEPIVYTVQEDEVTDYETSCEGYNVTNTHIPEKTSVSGGKTWTDNDNQDGKRPGSITIRLMNGEAEVARKTVTADDNWQWTFTDVDKYENGEVIEYTVAEDTVKYYTAEVNGTSVTNTHEILKTYLTVTKIWDDSNNRDRKRPESVTVKLLKNNAETEKTEVLNEDNEWTATFTDLDQYENGELITYTAKEVSVPEGYTVSTGVNKETGVFEITNSHEIETIKIHVEDVWIDHDNRNEIRPDTSKITILADGEVVVEKEITSEEDWEHLFEDLPKYKDGEVGKEIEYTIETEEFDDYTYEITGDSENGFVVTYKQKPSDVKVEKKIVEEDENGKVLVNANEASTGETIIYTLIVRNEGVGRAFDVKVKDILDERLENVEMIAIDYDPDAPADRRMISEFTTNEEQELTWNIGEIPAGKQVVITFKADIQFTTDTENPIYNKATLTNDNTNADITGEAELELEGSEQNPIESNLVVTKINTGELIIHKAFDGGYDNVSSGTAAFLVKGVRDGVEVYKNVAGITGNSSAVLTNLSLDKDIVWTIEEIQSSSNYTKDNTIYELQDFFVKNETSGKYEMEVSFVNTYNNKFNHETGYNNHYDLVEKEFKYTGNTQQ